MKVPFFDNQVTVDRIIPFMEKELDTMLGQSTLVNGDQVRFFEQAICTYTGAAYAIATGNATDSLIISLLAAGIGPGDEVIVPCYSFFASVSSILHVGAIPVFVDIEPGSYSMNANDIESRISNRTRAIMPVHLFRQMVDMARIQEISKRHNLLIIEDSAEGIGMTYDGRHSGLHGDVGVLSFFPTKTLGALGDAGMIITDNAKIAETARYIADNGRDSHGIAKLAGFNSRMDDLQALYLRLRFDYIEEEIRWRAHCAATYGKLLSPLNTWVTPPCIITREKSHTIADYVYLIETESRDELAQYLTENGIGTEIYYPLPLHLQPCCNNLGYLPGDFPVAENSANRALGLPMYADLTVDAIEHICMIISNFFITKRQAE